MHDIRATDAGNVATADAGGSWMTYDQLAAARQITRRAAIRLAQRHRLRRQPGNDGHARVFVPADMATSSPHRPFPPATDVATTPDDTPPNIANSFRDQALAALEDALRASDARAAEAGSRAEAALALADRLGAQLANAGERANALQTAIDELRAGQTLMAETHARDLAEAIRQAQEAAEETIRQRVDRLEHDQAAAGAIADEAVRNAEALRQAEAARKARGRLRRAWDGWRGR
jgi:hypothetical protein